MSYRDVSLAQLKIFEGQIAWMYRDTAKAGNCTCATGNMLPTVAAAQQLPWAVPGTSLSASPDQVAAEYARVMAMPVGLLAAHYHIPSSLVLSQDVMDALLVSRIDGFENELRSIYPGYDTQPDGAKLAEIDMIFNLGPAGLLRYHSMNSYILRGDYSGAAVCSDRNVSNPAFLSRNLWTKNQFRAAAGLPPVQL